MENMIRFPLAFVNKVEFQGQQHHFYFPVLGVKGDWPFLRAAFCLNCGFNCTKKCHLCDIPDSTLKLIKFFIHSFFQDL